jgi:hypothetical protein
VKKNHISPGAVCLLVALSIASGAEMPPAKAQPDAKAAPAAPTPDKSADADATHPQSFSGKVMETTNAANYTYVLVDTGLQKKWAAAPQFQVKAGDAITIEEGMPMPNYHSKTLNRDFEVVYFTGSALVGGTPSSAAASVPILPQGHPPVNGTAPSSKADLSGIKKAEGGKTIAEIFAAKTQITGKQVKVRGKVVKFNPMIMGKNWLHIRDGSGTEGSNDLTLTTLAEVKVGATVVATGTIAIDKDFGYGYKYNVIMEDAQLVIE